MSTFKAPSKRRDAVNEDVIWAMMRFKLVYVGRSMSRQRRPEPVPPPVAW